jgi:flavodoxin
VVLILTQKLKIIKTMKALVVYNSKTGTTEKMASQIAAHLAENKLDVKLSSIKEVKASDIEQADRLYMGTWTSGFMLFGQKPEKEWQKFSRQLPIGIRKRTTLFTTYKLLTGSMFKNMRRELSYKGLRVEPNALKSKTGDLTDIHKKLLLESLN